MRFRHRRLASLIVAVLVFSTAATPLAVSADTGADAAASDRLIVQFEKDSSWEEMLRAHQLAGGRLVTVIPEFNSHVIEVPRRQGFLRSLVYRIHGNVCSVESDPVVQAALASVYASPDDVDLWAGGLAEDHVPGALVGETFFVILKNQFERLRDGDRFWYDGYLTPALVDHINQQTLSRIIRRNTTIVDGEIPANVFRLP